MIWRVIWLSLCLIAGSSHAQKKILNVYAWGGEIPIELVHQFEKETGIEVNFSTYDNNETMYAKLRANKKMFYDIVFPSAYYVERMRKHHLLTPLDPTQLTHLQHIDPIFLNHPYDLGNHYSIPLVWGTTGIFYNQFWIKNPPTSWQDFWQSAWRDQLLLLDDIREVFYFALLSLGYAPEDTNLQHLTKVYNHLLKLVPNVKLFGSDAIRAIMIDEDVLVGMSWSGDAYKAQLENPRIQYIYPKDGFMIWMDCIAIPMHAPHVAEAYQFIDFLLEPKHSTLITLQTGYAITNHTGKQMLPKKIRENTTIYPSLEQLKHGYFQRDIGEKAMELYSIYWEKFKLAF